jgi:hypothetical protein
MADIHLLSQGPLTLPAPHDAELRSTSIMLKLSGLLLPSLQQADASTRGSANAADCVNQLEQATSLALANRLQFMAEPLRHKFGSLYPQDTPPSIDLVKIVVLFCEGAVHGSRPHVWLLLNRTDYHAVTGEFSTPRILTATCIIALSTLTGVCGHAPSNAYSRC